MLNRSFHAAAGSEKIDKIKQVLKSKNPKLSSEQLNLIIKHMDIEKQHYIKFTKKISKFENIITDEFISTDSRELESRLIQIYGNFKIGFYKNINGVISYCNSKADPLYPAAAIKILEEKKVSTTKSTMMIVMYQP